ncbi:rCG36995, isoform CRA_b [Rattus norvegicus]|uniref:RCG36995, isoform CRA_b n=1 Tax=Rattus norvegicus TaxID=10116 RepID=A6HUE9_RAT|nr:rCG36995, isoform CRA_b [Rattus norvegicus]
MKPDIGQRLRRCIILINFAFPTPHHQ